MKTVILKLMFSIIVVLIASKCSHSERRIARIPEFRTQFFSVPVPNGWSVEVKHENTVYLRKRSTGDAVMVSIWAVKRGQTPEEIVSWMRSEALELTSDGRFEEAFLKIGGSNLRGIKFIIKNKGRNKNVSFYEVVTAERISSKQVIGISIFRPNGRSAPEVDGVILKYFRF